MRSLKTSIPGKQPYLAEARGALRRWAEVQPTKGMRQAGIATLYSVHRVIHFLRGRADGLLRHPPSQKQEADDARVSYPPYDLENMMCGRSRSRAAGRRRGV